MAGIQVTCDNEVFYVSNTTIKRNEDDTCTASATIKGREISLTYEGKAVHKENYLTRAGKPWLRDVRLDLCREFIRLYGHTAAVRKAKKPEKVNDRMTVDYEFMARLRDKLGLDVYYINTGSYLIMVGKVELTKAKLGKTRKVDLCRRLREQIPLIKRIQTETAEVEDFFAEFSIA